MPFIAISLHFRCLQGRGRPAHAGGPRLYHEMAQHMPAGTPGGQSWHRDGDYIRCTFTLNDLGLDDGGRSCAPPVLLRVSTGYILSINVYSLNLPFLDLPLPSLGLPLAFP